jgi:hypothetical protein
VSHFAVEIVHLPFDQPFPDGSAPPRLSGPPDEWQGPRRAAGMVPEYHSGHCEATGSQPTHL